MGPGDFVLVCVLAGTGLLCLFLAARGLRTRKLIFKRGTAGYEDCVPLFWTQIVVALVIGFASIAAAVWGVLELVE